MELNERYTALEVKIQSGLLHPTRRIVKPFVRNDLEKKNTLVSGKDSLTVG